jgi:hypothetical protein
LVYGGALFAFTESRREASDCSTTIFWLMYRLSALVRRDLGFHDENGMAKLRKKLKKRLISA